jgi:hypothetical protein
MITTFSTSILPPVMKVPDDQEDVASPVVPKHQQEASMISEVDLFASPLPITGARKTTTRVELWVSTMLSFSADLQSWYVYYIGNSGLGPFNFAISAWQNLLYLAGWDPAFPGRSTACGAGSECQCR